VADIIAGDYGFDPNRLAHRLLVIRLEEIEKIIARSPQHNLFKPNKGDSLSGLFVRLYNYLSNELLVNSSIKVIRHNHESLRVFLSGHYKDSLLAVCNFTLSFFNGSLEEPLDSIRTSLKRDYVALLSLMQATAPNAQMLGLSQAARQLDIPTYLMPTSPQSILIGEGKNSVSFFASSGDISTGPDGRGIQTFAGRLRSHKIPVVETFRVRDPISSTALDKKIAQDYGVRVSETGVDDFQYEPPYRAGFALNVLDNINKTAPNALITVAPPGLRVGVLVMDGRVLYAKEVSSLKLNCNSNLDLDDVVTEAQLPMPLRLQISTEATKKRLTDTKKYVDQTLRLTESTNLGKGSQTPVDFLLPHFSFHSGLPADLLPSLNELVQKTRQVLQTNCFSMEVIAPKDSNKSLTVASVSLQPDLGDYLSRDNTSQIATWMITKLQKASSVSKIPKIIVTGSFGKTTTVRMISHALTQKNIASGVSTSQGTWVQNEQVHDGDSAGAMMARRLLSEKRVDVGVFELAHGSLMFEGLGVENHEIGIWLNLHENHVDNERITSIQQVAAAKALVITQANDLAILNAGDPFCMRVVPKVKAKKLGLVGSSRLNQIVSHAKRGQLAGWRTGDSLEIWDNGLLQASHRFSDFHISLNGFFEEVAVNILAAAMALLQLGVSMKDVFPILANFKSDVHDNIGRNNITRGLPFTLFESQADGYPALQAILPAVVNTAPGKKRALLTSAGDRPDKFIRMTADAVAGEFDEYFLTDWHDLRGRGPMEVPEILANQLIKKGVPPEAIHQHPLDEAIDLVKEDLGPDDLIFSILHPIRL